MGYKKIYRKVMKEIQTGCGNCWFCRNGQCCYADKCDYTKKWSNTLNSFVPTTYIELYTENWQ